MRYVALFVCLAFYILPALSNVEKIIFLAPEAVQIPQHQPNLESLQLKKLSPGSIALRRSLPASFPNPVSSAGTEAWFLLDLLREYQRYEVRICWPATVST